MSQSEMAAAMARLSASMAALAETRGELAASLDRALILAAGRMEALSFEIEWAGELTER
ncbi:MAG: hypothetical protein JNM89_03090 [Hyphomicrobiaceae bacterium]|nr:hypothetical protein [Hyphomicrobiaceae bacterium]